MSEARERPRRVLVTRLRFLGDVVLSTPLLAALKSAHPEASIEYLTFDAYAPILQEHPHVDRLHALPMGAGLASTLRMVQELRRPRVDWWIDLFGNPRSALLAALCSPRVSVGPDRGLRARVFHHRRGRPAGDPSAIRHHLDKLQPLLGNVAPTPVELCVSDAERQQARQRFKLTPASWPVLLHPGATWPSKAWPLSKWARLAQALQKEGMGPVWILSQPGEEHHSREIAALAGGAARVVESLPLRPLLALMAESRLYVGNDGGLLHCAVALKVPTVAIFGPTPRDIWFPHEAHGPYRLVQEFVPCRPCHLHECAHLSCLVDLPVHRVLEQARDLISTREAAARHA